MSKCWFLDIDGVLLEQQSGVSVANRIYDYDAAKLLPNVKEFLYKLDKQNDLIILTTGRRESLRKLTEEQLSRLGVQYNQLVMNCGNGKRIIVNNRKGIGGDDMCEAINVDRNEGIPTNLVHNSTGTEFENCCINQQLL